MLNSHWTAENIFIIDSNKAKVAEVIIPLAQLFAAAPKLLRATINAHNAYSDKEWEEACEEFYGIALKVSDGAPEMLLASLSQEWELNDNRPHGFSITSGSTMLASEIASQEAADLLLASKDLLQAAILSYSIEDQAALNEAQKRFAVVSTLAGEPRPSRHLGMKL